MVIESRIMVQQHVSGNARSAYMIRFKSEDDARRALGSALGGVPDPEAWAVVVTEAGRLDELLDPDFADNAFHELEARYREVVSLLRDHTPSGRRVPRGAVVPEHHDEPDPAALALGEIMAQEMGGEPAVVAFRERVLGGELLTHKEADVWLCRPTTKKLSMRVRPAGSIASFGTRLNPWESSIALDKYVAGKKPLKGATATDREMDFLWCLADVLIESYGWSDVWGVAFFLLTGATPVLYRFRSIPFQPEKFFPKSSTLVLYVNPELDPRELASLYREARNLHREGRERIRRPGEAAARLALFAARHNDGRTWLDLRKAWNAEYPDAQRTTERDMARDARNAYRLITGQRLEWKAGGSQARQHIQSDDEAKA